MATFKTIHKYRIILQAEECGLALPQRAKIISVQMQHGQPHMWVLANPKAKPVKRTFRWFATGQVFEYHPSLTHVATLQFQEETMLTVFHLFETTADGDL